MTCLFQDKSFFEIRAKNGTRTRDPQLGKLMLYQLSYFRMLCWCCKSKNSLKISEAALEKMPLKV